MRLFGLGSVGLSFPSLAGACVEHTFSEGACRYVDPFYTKLVCRDVVGSVSGN